MPLLTKPILKAGEYYKNGRKKTVTAQDLDEMAKNFRRMSDARLKVHLPWEHPRQTDKEAFPVDFDDTAELSERERSRLNAGWVKDIFLENGELCATLDVPRDDDLKQLETVGAFVSPQFGPFTDGKGRNWGMSVHHIALTNKPINPDQTPEFKRVQENNVSQFSLADYVGEVSQFGEKMPKSNPFDDDDDDENETDDSDDLDTMPPSITSQNPAEIKSPGDVGGDGSDKVLAQLVASLKNHGIIVPDDIDLKGNGVATLLAAVATCEATKTMHEKNDDDDSDKPGSPGQQEPIQEEPSTIAMSATKTQPTGKTAEELLREQQSQITQMSQQLQEHNKFRTETEQRDYRRRITEALKSGRCNAAKAKKLEDLAGTYQFSGKAQAGPTELDIVLREIEENPEGTFLTPEERLVQFAVKEVPQPGFFSGDAVSEERADEVADEVVGKIIGKK